MESLEQIFKTIKDDYMIRRKENQKEIFREYLSKEMKYLVFLCLHLEY